MKPKYLASTYIKYLAQSLVHMAVRGRKRGKRGQKRGRGMRSDASLGWGGGDTASPQAAITQQVISRCVCLACGAFSKKSVRTRPQRGPWQGGRRGEWADLPQVYSFLLVQVYRRLAPYTCRWYGLAPGGPWGGHRQHAASHPCLTVRDDAARARASAEGMQAMPAQPLSLDGPTVGGSKTRRQECLQQEGGASSNLRNAWGSCLSTKAHALSTTLPSSLQSRCRLWEFQVLGWGEKERLLQAGVTLRSRPIKNHLSPHTGRSRWNQNTGNPGQSTHAAAPLGKKRGHTPDDGGWEGEGDASELTATPILETEAHF